MSDCINNEWMEKVNWKAYFREEVQGLEICIFKSMQENHKKKYKANFLHKCYVNAVKFK
jgi:hypothetical protein